MGRPTFAARPETLIRPPRVAGGVALSDTESLILLLSTALVLLAGALLLVVRHYRDRVADLEHRTRSQAVVHGRINEQFAPFLARYPFDGRNFRFLGGPIDGVQFEQDRIVFVEFKTNTARLNGRQQEIRRLVEEKRVEWLTFEMREQSGP